MLSAVSAVLIIIGLSTLEWRTFESSGTKTIIGLKQMKTTYGSYSSTQDIPNSGDFVDYLKVAHYIMSYHIMLVHVC